MTEAAVYNDHLLLQGAAAEVFRKSGHGMTINLRGTEVHAVPHTDDSARVLNNMGLKCPAPMEVPGRYAWSGKFQPMAHQREVAAFYCMHDRCFNLSGMGTGKTAATVWAAEWLLQTKQIKRILVLAPLSCLRKVWADEVFGISPTRGIAVAHGSKKKREEAIKGNAEWIIMNHDGVRFEADALIKDRDIDLVIVDEFTAFKTHNSARSKALKRVAANRRLWMLSGTPTPQSPEDAYFPSKLVDPTMPYTLTRWRDATMIKLDMYKYLPRANANETVRQLMKPAILIKKEDVLDLPPVTYLRRECELSKAQKKAMTELRQEKLLMIKEQGGVSTSTAVNAAALASKLLQITQGSLLRDDGTRMYFPCETRTQEVASLIDQAQGKTIIFAPFTGSLDVLEHGLAKSYDMVRVDGSVSEKDRSQRFNLFQNATSPQVLIAHPKVASHGLTLTAATLTIWFGPTTSTETYLQANQRMNRPGQKLPMTIAHLGACAPEWNVYNALEGNAGMQDALLDMYKSY